MQLNNIDFPILREICCTTHSKLFSRCHGMCTFLQAKHIFQYTPTHLQTKYSLAIAQAVASDAAHAEFIHATPGSAGSLNTPSFIPLSCRLNPHTPTSSAMPDVFRSRLWVVIVGIFGARSDGAVRGSARIKNNYGHDQR